METIIPAGYRVTVDSWENDADAQRTIVKEGLDRDMAKFFVEFARLFYSQNNYRGPKRYGNMYEPSREKLKDAHAAAKKVILDNWGAFQQMWDDVEKEELDDEDCIWDLTAELHHELFGGSEYHFRVLEKVKVEYLPVEIRLNDVTGEF